jgi:hypothetical protein
MILFPARRSQRRTGAGSLPVRELRRTGGQRGAERLVPLQEVRVPGTMSKEPCFPPGPDLQHELLGVVGLICAIYAWRLLSANKVPLPPRNKWVR